MTKKLISLVTPCYNEEDNVDVCYETVKSIFNDHLKDYDYEHIFCDNNSTDRTGECLARLAAHDPRVKVIFNARNFGPFANLFNGAINTSGDAVVVFLAADLQDPPEIIPDMVRYWEQGIEVVFGVRDTREESAVMAFLRRCYYALVSKWSSIDIPRNAGEFQLVDRKVIESLRQFEDYYPYVRGMIASCGFTKVGIPYTWRRRRRGLSKSTLYQLIDNALNGIISTSNVPIRLCMFIGIAISLMSILSAVLITIHSMVFANTAVPRGIPMLIVFLLFFSGVQLFFLGMLGEYISAIHSQVRHRPLVIERRRLNFQECLQKTGQER